ncbi:MAG: nucleotide-binding protein [Candidatus Thorarchaeota archaeon]|jgi:MinD superfamily P-loop ATPase
MVAEIAVISGKGGTGKTTISAAFAAISGNLVIADCDVDAPDLHILLRPKTQKTLNFQGTKVASIDLEKCTECGLCTDKCRFDAARPPEIDQILCEGCGVCAYVCPEEAIEMKDRVSGYLYESETRFGPMSHARLLPGEGNSGKLVTEVRNQSQKMASANGKGLILIDGSPGIGCPVIATVTGIRLGVVVTEPTMSGIHDMKRVLELLQRFRVQPMVIINKYDLNTENSELIEQYCSENHVELLGEIPFDSVTTKSMVAAKTLPEFAPDHELTASLKDMWSRITAAVSG